MTIRKGQRLVNYIRQTGAIGFNLQRILFNMSDEEFDKVMTMELDYGNETEEEMDALIKKRVESILGHVDKGKSIDVAISKAAEEERDKSNDR